MESPPPDGSAKITEMTDSKRVTVRVEDHIAHVRLNRADKRNGLDMEMFEGLLAAADEVRRDRTVRAVVLAGEGKAFCAGLDWMSFAALGPQAAASLLAKREGSSVGFAQEVVWVWRELAVPVIAAVQGSALGGGMQLALAADVRIAAPDATFSMMEIRYGIIPDMTASQTLLELVRPDVARELIYTGRIVGAEEARYLGLVTSIANDPLEAATRMAAIIAEQSPHAVRAAKRMANDAPKLSADEGLALERSLQSGLFGTPNQLRAAQAMMTKQRASFDDPT